MASRNNAIEKPEKTVDETLESTVRNLWRRRQNWSSSKKVTAKAASRSKDPVGTENLKNNPKRGRKSLIFINKLNKNIQTGKNCTRKVKK